MEEEISSNDALKSSLPISPPENSNNNNKTQAQTKTSKSSTKNHNKNSTVFTDVLFGQQGSSTDDDTIQFIGNNNLANYVYQGKLKKCDMEMKGGSTAEVLNYAPQTYSKDLLYNAKDRSQEMNETNEEIQNFYESVLEETGLNLDLIPKMNKIMRDYELNMRLKMEITQVEAQIHSSKKRLESSKQAFIMRESLRKENNNNDLGSTGL